MPSPKEDNLTTLRIYGERFKSKDGKLSVDAMKTVVEITERYTELIRKVAKHLWEQENPGKPVPKEFDEMEFRVSFTVDDE